MYSCQTSFWRQQLFGQTFGTRTDLALGEVNYGGVQLGRSHEVDSYPQIPMESILGGMILAHSACVCMCVSRVCFIMSAPHITKSVTWNLRFHTSGNSNWHHLTSLTLTMSSCVTRWPSYTCSKAIPQNLWSIRKQHSEGFSYRCHSVVHIECVFCLDSLLQTVWNQILLLHFLNEICDQGGTMTCAWLVWMWWKRSWRCQHIDPFR